jgi:nitrogen fixation/metabolism regulation signal transduction histidine kinase
MTKPKPGRRTYLIDRGFQLKYTVLLVLSGTLISILFGTLAYLAEVDVHRSLAEELTRIGGRAADPTLVSGLVKESATTLLVLTLAVTVLMSTALGLIGILITHRVAGPLYVMSRYVNTLAEGRYPIFRSLRRSDELKTFFDQFRAAIDSLRRAEEADTVGIYNALNQLRTCVSAPAGQQALQALTAIYARRRKAEHLSGSAAEPRQPALESASTPRVADDGQEIAQ